MNGVVELRARGIARTIPERDDQKANRARRGSHGRRPLKFDRQRNQVERLMNRRKQYRAVATRYDCEDRRVPSRVVV